MRRPRPVSGRVGIDLLVVLAAVSAAVGTALRQDPPRPTGWALWWEVPAIALTVLTLLGRVRFPFAAPAAIWVAAAALSFVDGWLVPSQPAVLVAGLGAALLLGHLPDRRLALVGLVLCVVAGALVVENRPVHPSSELVSTPILFAVSWLVGSVLRERTSRSEAAEERALRAERDRETAARLAVAEERSRIARELHDVVAHALSVMVLQVGVVRRRAPADQEELRETLGDVEQAGRDALAEMRRLLEAVRGEEDDLELAPQPGLDDLPALVEEVRNTGLDVSLSVADGAPLPAVLDLSAYRVVQEGLTNVLKHAQAHRVEVDVRLGPADVLVEVRDDGRGSATGTDGGPGYGLVGIRERVSLLGGEMSAGGGPGGFVLRARLPRQVAP